MSSGVGGGGTLANNGADDDLLPSSGTSGGGDNFNEAPDGEGKGEGVLDNGLRGLNGKQVGLVGPNSGSLDDSIRRLSRLTQGSESSEPRLRNGPPLLKRSHVSFRLTFAPEPGAVKN